MTSKKKCIYCSQPVTESQLKHAEAIKTKSGYAHTECISDLSRKLGDAYRREAK